MKHRRTTMKLRTWLKDIGATDITVETTRGNHIRVRFAFGGRSHFVVMPSTSRNRRVTNNTKRDIRHMLGIVK